jgi:hypothetical protein
MHTYTIYLTTNPESAIPMFPMECILMARTDPLAPAAAEVLLTMSDSGVPPFPMCRIRNMMRRMREDQAPVYVYWIIMCTLLCDTPITDVPIGCGDDPLAGLLIALSPAVAVHQRHAAAHRFMAATFGERWGLCPWAPSRVLQAMLVHPHCDGCPAAGCNGTYYLCVTAVHRTLRTISWGLTTTPNGFGSQHRHLACGFRVACEAPECALVAACANDWWTDRWPTLAEMVRIPDVIHTVGMWEEDGGGGVLCCLPPPLGLLPHVATLFHSVWKSLSV